MNVKNCLFCGKTFNAKGNIKYCSDICRSNAKKENRKAWEKKSRYQNTNKAKKRALKNNDYEKQLELYFPLDKEYWIAFKYLEIKNSEEYNRTSTMTVNGISVYDEEFEEKVLKSIEKEQRILATAL